MACGRRLCELAIVFVLLVLLVLLILPVAGGAAKCEALGAAAVAVGGAAAKSGAGARKARYTPPRQAARRAPRKTARLVHEDTHVVVDTLNLLHYLYTTGGDPARVTPELIETAVAATAPTLKARYPGKVVYVLKGPDSEDSAKFEVPAALRRAAAGCGVQLAYAVREAGAPAPPALDPGVSGKASARDHPVLGRDDFAAAYLADKWGCRVLTRDRFRDFPQFRTHVPRFRLVTFGPSADPCTLPINPAGLKTARGRPIPRPYTVGPEEAGLLPAVHVERLDPPSKGRVRVADCRKTCAADGAAAGVADNTAEDEKSSKTDDGGDAGELIEFEFEAPDGDEHGSGVPVRAVAEKAAEWAGRLKDPEALVAPSPLVLRYDYPLGAPHHVRIEAAAPKGAAAPKELTRRALLVGVVRGYERIYAAEAAALEARGKATNPQHPVLKYNRDVTGGPHGIWGHGIGDLWINGVWQTKEKYDCNGAALPLYKMSVDS